MPQRGSDQRQTLKCVLRWISLPNNTLMWLKHKFHRQLSHLFRRSRWRCHAPSMVAFYRGVPSECKCCRTLGGFGGLICWQGRRAAAVTTQGRRDKDGCVHSHLANGFTKTTHCGFPGVRATQGLATSWVPSILISTFRYRALRAPSHSLLQAPVTALLYGGRLNRPSGQSGPVLVTRSDTR